MAQTFTLLGELFLEWDDIDNHIEESQKALSLLHTLKSKSASLALKIAQLLYNMAEGCVIHNKVPTARSYYQKALEELNGYKPLEIEEIKKSDELRKRVEMKLAEFEEIVGGKRKNAAPENKSAKGEKKVGLESIAEGKAPSEVNVPNVKRLK